MSTIRQDFAALTIGGWYLSGGRRGVLADECGVLPPVVPECTALLAIMVICAWWAPFV
jgi:hypothetical protein